MTLKQRKINDLLMTHCEWEWIGNIIVRSYLHVMLGSVFPAGGSVQPKSTLAGRAWRGKCSV